MSDAKLRFGATYLLFLAASALFAPWLRLRDPAAQRDGLVLRDLPPLSHVEEIRLKDDRIQLANEVRVLEDGALSYRRGDRWARLDPGELAGPSPAEWRRRSIYVLGTDDFGRDLLSRVVYGARVSLLVGFLGCLIAITLGCAVGLAAGLAGGWLDGLLMRLADLVLSIPRLFLLLLLVALYGPSLRTTILVLGCTTWMAAARIVRAEILSLRERDYVRAALASGASTLRVALLHLLPGVAAPLLVEGALRVGNTILLESSLSFLGLGVPPPAPSWGNLIAEGRDSLLGAWWIATLPGIAVATTVVAVSLVGDAWQDRLRKTVSGTFFAGTPGTTRLASSEKDT